MPELDLFAAIRGSVTAPAGCGKTHLIADTLALHGSARPILVLTHTNAGVAALRRRLEDVRVRRSAYRLLTIDGFAIRIISMFPMRSGHDPRLTQIGDPRNDYPVIRAAAARLLLTGHVNEVLRATYARLIVDEYQDCSIVQHSIVDALAMLLPTAVLGDPMQAIFGFADPLVDWGGHVQARFPPIGELRTPWRWRKMGAEALGAWLLQARDHLQRGEAINLQGAPGEVQWMPLGANPDQQRRVAAQTRVAAQESILIIGDSRNPRGRHLLTSQTPGATSVEAVDLGDLVGFARRFVLGAPNSLNELVGFAAEVMTQVGATTFLNRVATIRQGRARVPPTPAEGAAVAFAGAPSFEAALCLLDRLEEQPQARVYRPEVLHCCKTAMREAARGSVPFLDGVVKARERNRHLGRLVARRAVGSTLLLKGLEADVAVVLYPDAMDAPNLYVALTRGARRLVVCSATPELQPGL